MNKTKRVNYQDCGDQELIDLFGQLRDRDAVAELYERYRVSVGNFLYRDIKSKETVTDIFNKIILQLLSKPSPQVYGRKVSTKLFSMAYAYRREYDSKQAQNRTVQLAPTNTQENNEPKSELATLPRRHRDLIELVYKNNFTVAEVAGIIGCKASIVRSGLSNIRNQYQPVLGVSNA